MGSTEQMGRCDEVHTPFLHFRKFLGWQVHFQSILITSLLVFVNREEVNYRTFGNPEYPYTYRRKHLGTMRVRFRASLKLLGTILS